jgi:hypothetical protein
MFGYSGVELYTLDLALALQQHGHRVTVHASNWSDHLGAPLRERDIQTLALDERPDGVEVCISPKYLPLHAAHAFGKPCVQVIHSEHPTDVPVEHPLTRGLVTIRKGQDWLIRCGEKWATDLPHAMIRNPIGFDRLPLARFDRPEIVATDMLAGVVISEFDDMKVDLAEEYARHLHSSEPVVLVGPWRSERKIPEGCIHEGQTLDVAPFYLRARTAFSYRYSRTLVEAAWCNTRCYVKGNLEGEGPTREDAPGFSIIEPHEVATQDHAYPKVAAQFTELLERVLA